MVTCVLKRLDERTALTFCAVNNAGIDPYDYIRTADGFEMTMAVK